ncbi:MAG: HPr family phosphocarrier protein [Lachnospiraceae bacterium]|nr:HPr family phosphocarrier protein [Lachnospiraceae bacterium]
MRLAVKLPTVESAHQFCAAASRFEQDIDVKYRHYTLDAKSVLGVQSIPRNELLEVFIHNVDLQKTNLQEILEAFKPFEVK